MEDTDGAEQPVEREISRAFRFGVV